MEKHQPSKLVYIGSNPICDIFKTRSKTTITILLYDIIFTYKNNDYKRRFISSFL